MPYDGLPLALQLLQTLSLVVIVSLFLWGVSLYVRGLRAPAEAPSAGTRADDAFTWVFMVPAMNEEVTIADSVARLLALDVKDRVILVIDDGSDDRTPEILAAIDHPDVHVLRRDLPDARRGKAAALNAAYRYLGTLLPDVDRSRVIVGIVDADGRVAHDALPYIAAHFTDPAVGGVQSLVRIYNRVNLLTRLQHLEFAIYGRVFQAGRNHAGTAGMGGNGQYNRLSALDSIAVGEGPWRHKLTEDQDLGLRLLAAGWRGHQELRAAVDQQGVPRLRALFRQRKRWSQGNLQALALAGAIWRAPLPRLARLEETLYLLMPLWQGIVGLGVAAFLVVAATGHAALPDPAVLPVVYALGFGGTVLGCVAARGEGGVRRWLTVIVAAHAYAVYSWLLFPVLVRATLREVTARRDWSRTNREPLAPVAG